MKQKSQKPFSIPRDEDVRLESLFETIICRRLEGKNKNRCEEIVREHYSELLRHRDHSQS